jgi:hypothetical protein
MKFLVDAQLPRHLSDSMKWWGHDVVHTSDLPLGNRGKKGHNPYLQNLWKDLKQPGCQRRR